MTSPSARLTEAESSTVRACLERILLSAPFAQSGRLQRFLTLVVTETLAGHADRLKGYTIGVEVFDRDPSFDSAIDPIVRVEAARLRAKLREYYDREGRNDPIRLELPKGRYAVRIAPHPLPIEEKPSLAVLPFTNMSSDAEQGYFAAGVTDALITELSRLPDLFVISRHSSFAYLNMDKRVQEIGQELRVRYLLGGSVRRAGNRVRVTTQLIDASSGRHVWAERFDRELQDILAVEDDVVRRILAVLQVKLTAPDTGTRACSIQRLAAVPVPIREAQ
jgi:TolB-like protein